MEANEARTRWTYAEFARLPSETGTRHEVIDGELVVTPSPRPRHQAIVLDLGRILGDFVGSERLGTILPGPVDVLFAEGDYLVPDLVFVRKGRAGLVSDRGIEGPPDLIVEILSPSTTARDRGVKLQRYRLYGVREYWIVDPDTRSVEVWRFGEGAESAEVYGAVSAFSWIPLPGGPTLEVEVDDVFAAGPTDRHSRAAHRLLRGLRSDTRRAWPTPLPWRPAPACVGSFRQPHRSRARPIAPCGRPAGETIVVARGPHAR